MSPVTKLIRSRLEEACKAFTEQLKTARFSRTKRMYWVRPHSHTADVVYLHREGSTYGTPISAVLEFKVHFAIRVLNDSFGTIALNGPCSRPGRLRESGYHLRFHAESRDKFDRCVTDLVRFVEEQGERWFTRFRRPEDLIALKDSPLRPSERDALRTGMSSPDPGNVALSLGLLGLGKP